jgi:hypothetical protein
VSPYFYLRKAAATLILNLALATWIPGLTDWQIAAGSVLVVAAMFILP